jgi:hypothetical protein
VIAGSSTFVMIDQPQALADAIRRFLPAGNTQS